MEFGRKDQNFSRLSIWFIAGFGIIQGAALILWGSKGAVVTLGVAYIYVLCRWPHLALIAGVLVIFDGVGFINPDASFRIPGAFKLKDLIFLSLFLPLLLNGKWQKRAGVIFHDYRLLLLPILGILALTALQIVRTSLEYDLPLKTCIMASREYWYYAFLPLATIYIADLQKQKITYSLFLLVISVLAGIVVIQTVVLFQGGKLFLANNIQIQPKQWGRLNLLRIYLPGEPALVLGFALSFWGMLLEKVTRTKLMYAGIAIICAVAILLVNSRMRWFHALLIVLIPMVFLRSHVPKPGRGLGVLMCAVVLFVVLASGWTDRRNDYLSGIMANAISAWDDFTGKKGSWGGRLEDSRFRVKLIVEHPLFGLGLVHPDYAWRFGGAGEIKIDERVSYTQGVTSADSGIVDLLINFGTIGALWAGWYLIKVLGLCSRILRLPSNRGLHWLGMPLAGYMAGGLGTIATLGLFTQGGDIVSHSLALGIALSGECIQGSLKP